MFWGDDGYGRRMQMLETELGMDLDGGRAELMTSGQINGKEYPKILPGSWRGSWKNKAQTLLGFIIGLDGGGVDNEEPRKEDGA